MTRRRRRDSRNNSKDNIVDRLDSRVNNRVTRTGQRCHHSRVRSVLSHLASSRGSSTMTRKSLEHYESFFYSMYIFMAFDSEQMGARLYTLGQKVHWCIGMDGFVLHGFKVALHCIALYCIRMWLWRYGMKCCICWERGKEEMK